MEGTSTKRPSLGSTSRKDKAEEDSGSKRASAGVASKQDKGDEKRGSSRKDKLARDLDVSRKEKPMKDVEKDRKARERGKPTASEYGGEEEEERSSSDDESTSGSVDSVIIEEQVVRKRGRPPKNGEPRKKLKVSLDTLSYESHTAVTHNNSTNYVLQLNSSSRSDSKKFRAVLTEADMESLFESYFQRNPHTSASSASVSPPQVPGGPPDPTLYTPAQLEAASPPLPEVPEIEEVVGAKVVEHQLCLYVKWKGSGLASFLPSSTVARISPLHAIKYYESNLQFAEQPEVKAPEQPQSSL